ncbi:MAG: helix-turn-helix domain-containing protein [Candidatus Sulfobium sp.]|jgi:DNA-binding IclR family transcriptional regulator
MSKSYKRIEAVRRAGEILKFLANQKEPITAPAIAHVTGAPLPTVMCHLVTLEELGFVQVINDRWRIGLGLGLIWARVKANLEGERDRIERDLESIRVEEAGHGQ